MQSDIDAWINKYSHTYWCIILDDMQNEFVNSDISERLLSRLISHHRCFLFLLGHTLFPKGKHARLVSLNFHYYILTRSCRDTAQISTFGYQILGVGQGKTFLAAYLDATDLKPNGRVGYLFVNVHPRHANRQQRLFTNILPSEAPLVIYKTA